MIPGGAGEEVDGHRTRDGEVVRLGRHSVEIGILRGIRVLENGESFREVRDPAVETGGGRNGTEVLRNEGSVVEVEEGDMFLMHTGWDDLIEKQLDYRTRPCNLAELLPRLLET